MGKPDAPDYEAAAEATAAGDLEAVKYQTNANRPDQYSPWGSVTWDQDADGNWTQNTNLTADSQAALDAELGMTKDKALLSQSMMGRLDDEYGTEMDWSQFGDSTGLEYNADEIRQKAEDASYANAKSRLDQQYGQSDNALEISLRNRGLSEGDAAFDSAMLNQNTARTDAYATAQNNSVLQGREEADQMFNQQIAQTDYANNLRQSDMTEELTKRGFSLNEINAIMSGEQVAMPTFSNFVSANKAEGADYMGAANAQSNFDQANYQTTMSGLTSAASAASMFCDRRLKKNIRRIGTFLGFPLYSFDYIWGEKAAGVMADEVNPEAVFRTPSGFNAVNYLKLNAGKK